MSDEWCPFGNITLNLGVLTGTNIYGSREVTDALECEGGWKEEGKSPDDTGFTLLSALASSGQAITTAQPGDQ